jgi:hypothetical protein
MVYIREKKRESLSDLMWSWCSVYDLFVWKFARVTSGGKECYQKAKSNVMDLRWPRKRAEYRVLVSFLSLGVCTFVRQHLLHTGHFYFQQQDTGYPVILRVSQSSNWSTEPSQSYSSHRKVRLRFFHFHMFKDCTDQSSATCVPTASLITPDWM